MGALDRDIQVREQLERQRVCANGLQKLFDEVDVDGDGRISQEDFEKHVEDESVVAFLNCLELTGVEARRLFRLLDVNESGMVDAEEFVSGCMCLRGSAKTLDVVALMIEHRRFVERITAEMDGIRAAVNQNQKRTTRTRTPSARFSTRSDDALPRPTLSTL
eukprot:UN3478